MISPAPQRRSIWIAFGLCAAAGALFAYSFNRLDYRSIEHWLANAAIDWLRFVSGSVFFFAGLVWLYLLYFRRGQRRRAVFAVAVSFTVSIWLIELALRVGTDRYYWYGTYTINNAVGWYQHDPLLGFRGKPNNEMTHKEFEFAQRIKSNSLGLRDDPWPTSPTGQLPRALFLGDSFAWGWGVPVEQRYDRRVRDLLARRGHPFQPYNVSCPGYGTDQEYLILKEMLPRCCPQAVVLQFCINDFDGNNADNAYGEPKAWFTLDSRGELVMHSPQTSDTAAAAASAPPAPPQRGTTAGTNAGTNAGTKEGTRARTSDTLTQENPPSLARKSRFKNLQKNLLKVSHAYRWLYAHFSDLNRLDKLKPGRHDPTVRAEVPNRMEQWRVTLALLDAIRAECDRAGARLIILIVPERIGARYNSSLWFRDVINNYCKERGVPCVDLHVTADGKPFDFDYYRFVMDAHWNRRGHDVAARAIAPALEAALTAKPH